LIYENFDNEFLAIVKTIYMGCQGMNFYSSLLIITLLGRPVCSLIIGCLW